MSTEIYRCVKRENTPAPWVILREGEVMAYFIDQKTAEFVAQQFGSLVPWAKKMEAICEESMRMLAESQRNLEAEIKKHVR
jgi:hypothetical protein